MHTPPALLVVARHAESVRNVAKAGQVFFPDPEARRGLEGEADHVAGLTDTGRDQARALGERLANEFGAFDIVFHSGYRRTRDTAEFVLAAMPAGAAAPTVREHIFLRERDAGYTFNMTTDEAEAAFPWLQEYWRTVGPFFARPPGGESLADVAGRVQLFFESCERELADRRVLLVTHAGTMRMIRFLLERWTHDEAPERWRREPNGNASFVAYERGRLLAAG
ncbi:MAG: histidine phosphatase family protein [Acidobacteria bacterium]|nr:histidine phosphatase family protein [Acidobacteriota bacterium]